MPTKTKREKFDVILLDDLSGRMAWMPAAEVIRPSVPAPVLHVLKRRLPWGQAVDLAMSVNESESDREDCGSNGLRAIVVPAESKAVAGDVFGPGECFACKTHDSTQVCWA